MNAPRLLPLLAALPLVLLGCGHHHSGGTVVVPPGGGPPAPLQEIEPNDNADFADYIGELIPGDFVEIEGHITECCPDPYDGFAFYAPGPVELVFTLHEDSIVADLDFCIYDPAIDQMVACFETDSHPEIGVFDFAGPGELHIVIASYFGDSSYLLQIDALPLPSSFAALQADTPTPNSAPSSRAHERFSDYHAEREPLASKSSGRELLLLGSDSEEALLLPRGALSQAGL